MSRLYRDMVSATDNLACFFITTIFQGSYVLVAFTSKQSILIYSIPHLELMHTLNISRLSIGYAKKVVPINQTNCAPQARER
jgi:hypothetical protein